jgi:hypothetical protein
MSGIKHGVVTSPTSSRSRRAALKAILAARDQEATQLRAVIESKDCTAEAKQNAVAELAALSKDTLLRAAEIGAGLDVNMQRATEPPALAPPVEIPTVTKRTAPLKADDSEAA